MPVFLLVLSLDGLFGVFYLFGLRVSADLFQQHDFKVDEYHQQGNGNTQIQNLPAVIARPSA